MRLQSAQQAQFVNNTFFIDISCFSFPSYFSQKNFDFLWAFWVLVLLFTNFERLSGLQYKGLLLNWPLGRFSLKLAMSVCVFV